MAWIQFIAGEIDSPAYDTKAERSNPIAPVRVNLSGVATTQDIILFLDRTIDLLKEDYGLERAEVLGMLERIQEYKKE